MQAGPGAAADAAIWFFNQAQDLFVVAAPDGRLVHFNPAWVAATGWTIEELAGRALGELVREDSRAHVQALIRETQTAGRGTASAWVATKAGGWLWLEGSASRGP